MDEDEWVPQISCQACGASWDLETTIRHHCKTRWGSGSPSSPGTAGAPGPLMTASGWTDPRQVVVCTTPEDGSNTYQGRVWDISLRSSGGPEDGFILMAYFDSETAARLLESRYGRDGALASDAVRYSLTIVSEGPPTT